MRRAWFEWQQRAVRVDRHNGRIPDTGRGGEMIEAKGQSSSGVGP